MHSPFIGNAQKITYPDLKFAYKLRGLYMKTFAVYLLKYNKNERQKWTFTEEKASGK